MLNGVIHHISRPDRTNLSKLYEDVLNGIVIDDDSQIVDGTVKKIYSDEPKTIITVIPL